MLCFAKQGKHQVQHVEVKHARGSGNRQRRWRVAEAEARRRQSAPSPPPPLLRLQEGARERV